MNFARVDEFLDRSVQAGVATGGCFCLFSQSKLLKWNNLLSQAAYELITDSYKSTQVQYNRAKPFITPILNSQDFLCQEKCSNNVVKIPPKRTNPLDKASQVLHNDPLPAAILSKCMSDKLHVVQK